MSDGQGVRNTTPLQKKTNGLARTLAAGKDAGRQLRHGSGALHGIHTRLGCCFGGQTTQICKVYECAGANAGSAFSDSSCHVASPHEGHAIFGAVELWHPKSPSSVNVTSSKCCKHDSRGTSLACLFAMRRRFSFGMATLSTSVRKREL